MIIEISQGSPEWLELRRTKITATDAPVAMGLSPFKSANRLLWQKLGILPEDAINDAMLEGQRLEPLARELFEIHADIKMTPTVHVGVEDLWCYDWAMCSTDGLSDDHSLVIEIKSGKKSWEMAQNGLIPLYYKIQIQHILWLTGAERCDYVAFNGEQIKIISVEPDLEFRQHMIEEEYKFYVKMQSACQSL